MAASIAALGMLGISDAEPRALTYHSSGVLLASTNYYTQSVRSLVMFGLLLKEGMYADDLQARKPQSWHKSCLQPALKACDAPFLRNQRATPQISSLGRCISPSESLA
jgi:hypothetical protein